MGHWYDWGGGEHHTVIAKSGKNKGEPRDTTLFDARRNNWLPGFGGVWGVMSAPQLENWKRKQLLLAACECRVAPFEGDQAWMDKVLDLYEERTTKARDLGSEIHREIEKALVDTVWIPSPEASAAIKALGEWCGYDSIIVEKSFGHKLGFGGRCDVHKMTGTGWVVDFKSKEFAEHDLPPVYDNHAAQLAAYREGLGIPNARCAIIYISTSVQGLTHTVEIPEDDLAHGWSLFVQCLSLWRKKNKYWPMKEEELA